MRVQAIAAAVTLTAVLAAFLAASSAAAQTCEALWIERNQYFKSHGYCFKTQRAIAFFGNDGCFINDENAVPLSTAERSRIAQIQQIEQSMNCSAQAGGGGGMATCDQLWVARNAIYKGRGYCFKTEKAITYFGNGGCIYQDAEEIPFTQAERNLINSYRARERAMGCP